MANLKEIATSMKIDFDLPINISGKKIKGKKRRPWFENIEGDQNVGNEQIINKQSEQIKTKRLTNGKQTVNKRYTQPVTNGKQTVNKKPSISSLVGIQRKVIFAIYQNCKLLGENVTQEITLDYIASIIESHKNTVKTTINRLKKKSYIEIAEYKDGRGGWVKYRLPQAIYVDLIRYEKLDSMAKNDENGKQTVNKRYTQPVTKTVKMPPSSSSSFINNNTTTTEQSEKWLNIDLSPLKEFGFTKDCLEQLYKSRITTPDNIKKSIDHFAFDLRENNKAKKIKTNPLNYFMGIMKRTGLYLPPDNYESVQDKTFKKMLKIEKEKANYRQEQIDSLFKMHFDLWYEQQTNVFLKTLIPNVMVSNFKRTSKFVLTMAKEHFKNTDEWQQILAKLSTT